MELSLYHAATMAAKRRDRSTAFTLMRHVLREHPNFARGWLEMSKLVDSLQQRCECLERAVALDPSDRTAREELERVRVQQLLAPISLVTEPEPQPERKKLGEYLVESGLLSSEQLEDALREQAKQKHVGDGRMLGRILLQQQLLTPEQLAHILIQQLESRCRSGEPVRRLGEHLLESGLITTQQLEYAFTIQLRVELLGKHIPIGEILIRQGCVTREQINEILAQQQSEFNVSFGD